MRVKDRKGFEITLGAHVLWHDPEESARDLSRVWNVDDFNEEIVYISDEFGEAEVFPHELEVIN
jgi:hypothetical protein